MWGVHVRVCVHVRVLVCACVGAHARVGVCVAPCTEQPLVSFFRSHLLFLRPSLSYSK